MGPFSGPQGTERIGESVVPAEDDEDPAQHRVKAEACRRLADLAEDAERKALWTERADKWEQLARKATKRLRTCPGVR